MNFSFTSSFNYSDELTFSNNKVGYFYNIKEEKYFNCNNVTKKDHILPILTTVPSSPWKIKEIGDKYILECGNGKVLDIAWNDYLTVYYLHKKINQQFIIEIISEEKFTKLRLQYEDEYKKKDCFTSKLGRIIVDKCEENDNVNDNLGQVWYWIPEQQVEEMIFKPMREMLEL